jgi:ribulose-phosphate 3-epimerase
MIALPKPPARLVSPSVLSSDFARLGDEVRAVAEVGADWIHVDVMDGVFVPNITIGVPVVQSLRAVTDLPLDVHLMIVEPERHVARFAEAGADVITVHAEASVHLQRVLAQIRDLGVRAGVALNPATPLDVLDYVLDDLDVIMVMSVNPGFGGQRFLTPTYDKLRRLSERLARHPEPVLVEVDGGVGPSNARAVREAGGDVLVAGSAVYGSEDYGAVIAALKA